LRPIALGLIDRIDKLSAEKWQAYGVEKGLSVEQVQALAELLKDEQLWQKSPHMQALFALLEQVGLREWVCYDATIVRGLAYYTGIVFEARDRAGEFRAIFGGGRYDNLVAAVGGDSFPAIGFAMGDMVIALVLEKFGLVPNLAGSAAKVLVTLFSETLLPNSLALATQLRQAGISCELFPTEQKMARQFKYADQQRIPLAVVLGPDEVAQGLVTLKDLRTATQRQLPQSALVDAIRQAL
ncbi:MAG TPA: ATP phosphoribosyltransferase regulatory subunit, partial [Anaerolineales bacterium]|nr:ATP phosphoribosyltransferase regulatory subunit [Anaerolineales bacterium]